MLGRSTEIALKLLSLVRLQYSSLKIRILKNEGPHLNSNLNFKDSNDPAFALRALSALASNISALILYTSATWLIYSNSLLS